MLRLSSRVGRRAFAGVAELAAPTYKTVPFAKEDMEKVMKEVPDFDFYHIGYEHEPNKYRDVTLAQSVLEKEPTAVPAAGKTEYSKLENGLRVVSVDKGGGEARLGLFVKAGSRWEAVQDLGCTHMMELVAFKSTAHLSHLRTVKTLECLGVDAQCTASREHIAYTAGLLREHVAVVVPLLIGNVLFPRFLPWEVAASHELVEQSRFLRERNTDGVVTDMLVQTAYHTNTLGQPMHSTVAQLGHFKPEALRDYVLKHFAPERMVMVGVNCDHAELAKWCMRAFVDYNAIPLKERAEPKPTYTGGSRTVDANLPTVHVAVGFQTGGWASPDAMPVAVLQALLGGALSEAAALPGAGAQTRLAGLLGKNVESAVAFNQPFSDSGIFGVYLSAKPEAGAQLPQLVAEEAKKLSKVDAAELEAAKNSVKTSITANLEDAGLQMEDMGGQVLMTGRAASAEELCSLVDQVTAADVQNAAKKVFASPPTLVTYGNCSCAPLYSDVVALFKK